LIALNTYDYGDASFKENALLCARYGGLDLENSSVRKFLKMSASLESEGGVTCCTPCKKLHHVMCDVLTRVCVCVFGISVGSGCLLTYVKIMVFGLIITYPASWGYLVEQIAIAIPSLMAICLTVAQFCVWTMPSSRDKVKKLQIMSQLPVFLQNVCVLLIDADIRCVLGIYSPALLIALTAVTVQFPAVFVIVWLQELTKVLTKSEEVGLTSFRISMTFNQEPSVISTGSIAFAITAFVVTCMFSVIITVWKDRIVFTSIGVFAMAILTLSGVYFITRFLKLLHGYGNGAPGRVVNHENQKHDPSRLRTRMWKVTVLSFMLFCLVVGFGVHLVVDLPNESLNVLQANPEDYHPDYLVWGMVLLNFITSLLLISTGWMSLAPLNCCIGCICCKSYSPEDLKLRDFKSEPLLMNQSFDILSSPRPKRSKTDLPIRAGSKPEPEPEVKKVQVVKKQSSIAFKTSKDLQAPSHEEVILIFPDQENELQFAKIHERRDSKPELSEVEHEIQLKQDSE
jgi:hypothetical protein